MTREHPDEPDLIADIRVDHDEMRRYFDMYKKSTGDDAHKWFNQFVWEVCRHSAAEEVVVYPMLDTMGEEGRKLAEKSRADHLQVKQQLVSAQKENDPNKFNAIFDDLFKTLTDHMKFEEGPGGDLEWIENFSTPKDRKWASRRFRAAKAIAPTEPHPSVPMKPAILEQGLALLTAPFDKLKDFFKEFPSEEEMRQAQP